MSRHIHPAFTNSCTLPSSSVALSWASCTGGWLPVAIDSPSRSILKGATGNESDFPLSTPARRTRNVHLVASECNCPVGLPPTRLCHRHFCRKPASGRQDLIGREASILSLVGPGLANDATTNSGGPNTGGAVAGGSKLCGASRRTPSRQAYTFEVRRRHSITPESSKAGCPLQTHRDDLKRLYGEPEAVGRNRKWPLLPLHRIAQPCRFCVY